MSFSNLIQGPSHQGQSCRRDIVGPFALYSASIWPNIAQVTGLERISCVPEYLSLLEVQTAILCYECHSFPARSGRLPLQNSVSKAFFASRLTDDPLSLFSLSPLLVPSVLATDPPRSGSASRPTARTCVFVCLSAVCMFERTRECECEFVCVCVCVCDIVQERERGSE